MFSDHNEIKLEINNKEIWEIHRCITLNNTLLNKKYNKEKNDKKNYKIEINENDNTTWQTYVTQLGSIYRENNNFKNLNLKEEMCLINNLNFLPNYLKNYF